MERTAERFWNGLVAMYELHRLLTNHFNQEMGITFNELRILMAVFFQPRLPLHALTERSAIDAGNLSRCCSKLEQKNLLVAERSREDGRSVLFSLTGQGEEVVRDFEERVGHFRHHLVEVFSLENADRLDDGLDCIQRYIEEYKNVYHLH